MIGKISCELRLKAGFVTIIVGESHFLSKLLEKDEEIRSILLKKYVVFLAWNTIAFFFVALWKRTCRRFSIQFSGVLQILTRLVVLVARLIYMLKKMPVVMLFSVIALQRSLWPEADPGWEEIT